MLKPVQPCDACIPLGLPLVATIRGAHHFSLVVDYLSSVHEAINLLHTTKSGVIDLNLAWFLREFKLGSDLLCDRCPDEFLFVLFVEYLAEFGDIENEGADQWSID